MSKRDHTIALKQMLDHAREAVSLIKGKSPSDLNDNRLLNLGLVRLLEVIGEAAGRITKEDRARYPSIPWSQIMGMRNRLIHGYDAIDLDLVWIILTKSLPSLILQLEHILD